MHDGRFSSLEQVLEHYSSDTGIAAVIAAAPQVERLSKEDQRLLIAFLDALTDREFLERDYAKCSL
jgi:hypothetical protein